MGEMRRARRKGVAWSSLVLSGCAPPSQHLVVFTNLEALCTLPFRSFYGGFIMKA